MRCPRSYNLNECMHTCKERTLGNKKEIRSSIVFPARLKFFEKDGKIKMFDNPQVVAESKWIHYQRGKLESWTWGLHCRQQAGKPPAPGAGNTSRWIDVWRRQTDFPDWHERARGWKGMCILLKQKQTSRECDSLQVYSLYLFFK